MPNSTLVRALAISMHEGLRHVHTGNVHHRESETTLWLGCCASLIERDWIHVAMAMALPKTGGQFASQML